MKENKVCPNCNDEHNSRSDYCQNLETIGCPVCGKEFDRKCNSRLKQSCSHKCSVNNKKNKCLTCGDPAKEKYCRKDIIIVCKVCNNKHKTKCGEVISKYCSGQCAMKDEDVKNKVKDTQIKKYGSFGFNTDKQRKTMRGRQ